MSVAELFEKHNDEYGKFERVAPSLKVGDRADVTAFAYLARNFTSKSKNVLAAAEHDEVWLDFGEGDLESLTEEEVIFLLRCGVRYDSSTCSLAMFV